MSAIRKLLKEYAEISIYTRDKGDKVEQLIKLFLKKDSVYSLRYSDVWLYREWAEKNPSLVQSKQDVGIDLVAREKNGDLVAIQCKFYDESTKIDKKDLDSFISTTGKVDRFGKHIFSGRIICITSELTKHARELCENQKPVVSYITINTLEDSNIDWSEYSFDKTNNDDVKTKPKKELRPHQIDAVEKTIAGFETADRGKLIMACGTGKTFTSLKIMERMVKNGDNVLFLVPSISLLSQTIREWSTDKSENVVLNSFAVCSDTSAGVKSQKNDDEIVFKQTDLAYPATTDVTSLLREYHKNKSDGAINVFFSTYHSIQILIDAQEKGGNDSLPEFALIVCDEAHRTTGAEEDNKDKTSAFNLVHDNSKLKAKKRLYMTATPRVYSDSDKDKAKDDAITVYSMDDEEVYGKEFYRINFSKAVDLGLLTDYKVFVLAVSEDYINREFQDVMQQDYSLDLPDTAKIIGCWNGLGKILDTNINVDFHRNLTPEEIEATLDVAEIKENKKPMKRAVAFCKNINVSKEIGNAFSQISDELRFKANSINKLKCELKHVDGTQTSLVRNESISWLKEDTDDNVCRILTNVRCLSEGVDVPALDAVMFLHPRDSQVDIIQAVGRVMRKSEGKDFGYIIIPVAIPLDIEPEEALDKSKDFKTVWKVLQALRSHDDNFNNIINKLSLNKGKSDKILLAGLGLGIGKADKNTNSADGANRDGSLRVREQSLLWRLADGNFADSVFARLVKKCGDRLYLEQWSDKVSIIAERHVLRINEILKDETTSTYKAFERFVKSLHKTINNNISKSEAIEMLAQHIITKPVFDALFSGDSFAQSNPVSKAMEKMVEKLEKHRIDTETKSLESLYESVRKQASGIDNLAGKQRIITELYEQFFQKAFPKLANKHGIVYTPIEIVDFIIHSVEYVLKDQFGKSLNDSGISILDPFTGTGTFIVRLLQSGIITKEQLIKKYINEEIRTHEIVLLAYYIATVNIEQVYQEVTQSEEYKGFKGAIFTDTFYDSKDEVNQDDEEFFIESVARKRKEKATPINVIIGNPPYSAGQKDANDNNANNKYPYLDGKIEISYAKYSSSTNKNKLYDSYVRAFRWASDKVDKDCGVLSFVTNGGYIDSESFSGFRKCLKDEFTSIYIFNLRGNARVTGKEAKKKEGGNVFDIMTSVAIIVLVKNSKREPDSFIRYYKMKDYASKKEKIDTLIKTKDISNIKEEEWRKITPNEKYDWLNQRDKSYDNFIELGNKKDKQVDTIFNTYSLGLNTNKDVYLINSSKKDLENTVKDMIDYYNLERERYHNSDKSASLENFIKYDKTKISFAVGVIDNLERNKNIIYNNNYYITLYRPFEKRFLYNEKMLIERTYLNNSLFPTNNTKNLYIVIANKSTNFSTLTSNIQANLELLYHCQCFPLYYYDKSEDTSANLMFGDTKRDINNNDTPEGYVRKDAINDSALEQFKAHYQDNSITKEDIFYYIYGLFHSDKYKEKYASNLQKEMPRIPFCKDFRAFEKAGRDLAEIHINYETVKPYLKNIKIFVNKEEVTLDDTLSHIDGSKCIVEKMKFGKDKDRSTIIFNDHITITGIPLEAYDYMLNGTSAIETVMARYLVSVDKDSGIKNDPNQYSADARLHNLETNGSTNTHITDAEAELDKKYILLLLLRVINISMQTNAIVEKLPELDIQQPTE